MCDTGCWSCVLLIFIIFWSRNFFIQMRDQSESMPMEYSISSTLATLGLWCKLKMSFRTCISWLEVRYEITFPLSHDVCGGAPRDLLLPSVEVKCVHLHTEMRNCDDHSYYVWREQCWQKRKKKHTMKAPKYKNYGTNDKFTMFGRAKLLKNPTFDSPITNNNNEIKFCALRFTFCWDFYISEYQSSCGNPRDVDFDNNADCTTGNAPSIAVSFLILKLKVSCWRNYLV